MNAALKQSRQRQLNRVYTQANLVSLGIFEVFGIEYRRHNEDSSIKANAVKINGKTLNNYKMQLMLPEA